MKRVFLLILLILPIISYSQKYDTLHNYGVTYPRIQARTQFNIPVTDDTSLSSKTSRIGAIRMATDGTLKSYNGTDWVSMGNSSVGAETFNPNIFRKLRDNGIISGFLSPYATNGIQYTPEPVKLGGDTIIFHSKNEVLYSSDIFLSTDKGKTVTWVDTFISTLPADTAFNYTRVRSTVSIMKDDSLITLFNCSAGSFGEAGYVVGRAAMPRNNLLTTVSKTNIKKFVTVEQATADFGLNNADFISPSDIKKVGDTFYVYLDVQRIYSTPYFSYVVLYKSTDLVNRIPVGVVMTAQKGESYIGNISIIKLKDSLYYCAITAARNASPSSQGGYIRHIYSSDLIHWSDSLKGKFLEPLGYASQVTRCYAGQYLYADPYTNMYPQYYGDTIKYYYSASDYHGDRAFCAYVFPYTTDGYLPDNQGNRYATINSGGVLNPHSTFLYIGDDAINKIPFSFNITRGLLRLGINNSDTATNDVRLLLSNGGSKDALYIQNEKTGYSVSGTTGVYMKADSTELHLGTMHSSSIVFKPNNVEKMRLTATGNLQVNNHATGAYTDSVIVHNVATNEYRLSAPIFDFSNTTLTTGSYSPTTQESFRFVTGGSSITLTGSFAGQRIRLHQEGAGTTTITPSSGTIDGNPNTSLNNNHENIHILFDGTNYHTL